MKYQKDLVDDRGKIYPRKNEYIKDIIDGKNPDRNSHPYIIKLNEYQKKEKELLDKAKKEADSLETSSENSSEFKDLNKKLYISKAMVEFYEENSYLTYDASLKAKQAEIYLNQIPQIIEHDLDLKNKLTDKSNKISLLSEKELNDANEKIAKEKKILEEEYQKSLDNLKESFEKNLISAKAYKSEKEKYKKRFEDSNKAIEFLNPKNSLEEEIKSLKYKVKQDVKEQRKILASDLAEARRRNPVETEKTSPWRSIVSLPLPGLGQLLNGQWQKALVFFLGSLFIYLIAIPYALGLSLIHI